MSAIAHRLPVSVQFGAASPTVIAMQPTRNGGTAKSDLGPAAHRPNKIGENCFRPRLLGGLRTDYWFLEDVVESRYLRAVSKVISPRIILRGNLPLAGMIRASTST